jgi:predicted phosphodiesterase
MKKTYLGLFLALGLSSFSQAQSVELLGGPYVIGLSKTAATVAWHTEDKSTAVVKFRPAGKEKWTSVAAASKAFQAVKLQKLTPGTLYQVQVFAAGQQLGALTFSSAPAKATDFTFFAYGDTRSYPNDHLKVARAMAAEAKRIKQVTFTLFSGDMSSSGFSRKSTAKQFFIPAKSILQIMPILPVRGNHDTGTELFNNCFPAPPSPPDSKGARDYVFDYGSLRIIVFDQYIGNKDERLKWLSERLAEASKSWRIVSFHEPIYSSGSHGSDKRWREKLEPILIKGRVHLVICGHDHNYERTRPQHGITHIVTGGGGAPLRPLRGRAEDFSAFFKAIHHFLSIKVSPKTLLVKALLTFNKDGSPRVLDQIEIPRKCQWPGSTPE